MLVKCRLFKTNQQHIIFGSKIIINKVVIERSQYNILYTSRRILEIVSQMIQDKN